MSLLIIGAGHVFRIEEPIRALIHAEAPSVVALELDAARYRALQERAAGTYDASKAAAGAGRAYRMLARFQEEVADSLGTEVGSEMWAAALAAQSVGSQVALIDRPADATVRRLWDAMSWREKARLFFSSLFVRVRLRKGKSVEAEVARYQADPGSYLAEMGRSYPTLKRVLLDERNEHMALELRRLVAGGRRVVAVVGDGHVEGLVALLRDVAPRTVRLADLRRAAAAPVQWRASPQRDKVGFSFEQRAPEGSMRRGRP
jgi:pheromone shutdown protein TraB